MAKLWVLAVLCVAAVALADDNPKNFLNDGRARQKLARFLEDTHNLGAAYRNLVLDTPGSKVRLVNCANDVMQIFQSSSHVLNQGIASIKNQALRENQCKLSECLSESAHEIQKNLCGDPEKLRELLVGLCEKFTELGRKLSKDMEVPECGAEHFFGSQLRQALNDGTYVAQKTKLEIDHGKKSNKELIVEMDAALEEFCKCIPNIKGDDPKSKEELVYLIENLQRIGENALRKLKNFLHINCGDQKSIEIVKELAKALSSSGNLLHLLATESHSVTEVVTDLEKGHKHITALIKKLCEVDVGENTSCDLIIRSILFDNMAVSKVFERELKLLGSHPVKSTKN